VPEFKMADYGVIGVVLLIILVIVWKLPEFLQSLKGEKESTTTTPTYVPEVQTNEMLQSLANAIFKLTAFLETDTAVNKEKDKALYKQLSDIQSTVIEVKVSTEVLYKLVSEHCIKCDIGCHNK
jgi:hypothetical protein